MANCSCDVVNKMLYPGVFNLKQFLNETEVMRWKFSSRYCENNNIDFMNYDAFLVLQKSDGELDEVSLTSTLNDDGTITLSWNIGKHMTWLTGRVKYQIVFRGKCKAELSVMMPDMTDPAHGVYAIDNELSEGYGRSWTHKINANYKINYDSENGCWRLMNGDSIVSYQTFAHPEPYCGIWDVALVGNATACTWRSLEAIMYISESIAADEHITAKCPTILRQMWQGLHHLIVKSGVTVIEKEITVDDWQGEQSPYYIEATNLTDGEVPAGCSVVDVRLYEGTGSGNYSNIANVRFEQNTDGNIFIYSLSKVSGKIAFIVKGGNGYFVPEEADNVIPEHTHEVSDINGGIKFFILGEGEVLPASTDKLVIYDEIEE